LQSDGIQHEYAGGMGVECYIPHFVVRNSSCERKRDKKRSELIAIYNPQTHHTFKPLKLSKSKPFKLQTLQTPNVKPFKLFKPQTVKLLFKKNPLTGLIGKGICQKKTNTLKKNYLLLPLIISC
jgi:hypothetical protein